VKHTPTLIGHATAALSFGDSRAGVELIADAFALDNSNIFITIDQPAASGAALAGKIAVYGWAIANHEGIGFVWYSIDDPSNISANAGYSASRADVCQAHPGVWGCPGPEGGYPGVGWSFDLDTTGLSNGSHTLYIKAAGLSSRVARVVSRAFTVTNRISAATPWLEIDQPRSGATLSGAIDLSGWAIGSGTSPVPAIHIAVDGAEFAQASVVQPRGDVCTVYPDRPACPNVGWSYLLDTTQLADGPHTLTFFSPASDANVSMAVPVTIANLASVPSDATRLVIDTPGPKTGSLNGTVTVNGWALAGDADISSVFVAVDGTRLGSANYGTSRLDVCVVYPNSVGCPKVGWTYALDTGLLADGAHQLQVSALSSAGKLTTVSSPFQVLNAGAANSFHAYIDYPAAGGTVSGTAAVSGWALNDNAPVDLVSISVDGVPDGSALPSGRVSRWDVCAVYSGRADCPNVGWNYALNTLKFADGTHTLDVTLTSGAQHATFSTAFTTANATLGNSTLLYIDQPTDGASVPLDPSVTVSGWAVDDHTALGPIVVSVDGIKQGEAFYRQPRADVCAAYPGRIGCPNVGWFYRLDTQWMTDGLHTLTVIATGTTRQSASVKINVATQNAAPLAFRTYIDQPNANSPALRGEVPVSGWAITPMDTWPLLDIYVDSTLITTVVSFDVRPDVCAVFGNPPVCPHVGWSVNLDTTRFEDGPHTLKAVAASALGSTFTAVPITIANFAAVNPVHLAIDSSAAGTLSGAADLWGWALSDNGPIGAVAVAIDGAVLGNGSYGESRGDVCAVYQNRLGCPNVGWRLPIDTTGLSNGVHAVSVTATDAFGEQSTQAATVTVKN
jgi:hypothetical protein